MITSAIWAFVWPDKFADSWKDVIELVFITVAAIIALIQLQLLVKQSKEQLVERNADMLKERRLRTLELDAKIAELTSARIAVEKVFPPGKWQSPIPVNLIQEEIQRNPEFERELVKLLGQFEIFSLPICAESADEDMAFELLGGALVWYGTAFREFIQSKRLNDNRPRLYVYLTYLADKWAARIKAETESWKTNALPFFIRQKTK